jgi:hypothetical protein
MNTITQSDVFSFRRLYWFARKEILENWKTNLLSLAAILAINVGYYAIEYQGYKFLDKKGLSTSEIGTKIAFALTVIIGVLVVADQSFQYFSTKPKTIAAFTTPVSVLERMAWFLIYTFPIFISAAFIVWKCVSWVAIPIFEAAFPTLGSAIVHSPTVVQSDYDFTFIMAALILIAALGGITLGRISFLKTLSIGIIAITALTAINSLLIRFLLVGKPDIIWNSNSIFTNPSVSIWQGSITKYLVSSYENIGQYWLYCLPVLLLVTIYFKIKDKEV